MFTKLDGFVVLVFMKAIICMGEPLDHHLKSVSVWTFVCVFMRLPLRLLLTSAVIWTPCNWLNKFYSCYMATVVGIINGYSLGIDTHHGN